MITKELLLKKIEDQNELMSQADPACDFGGMFEMLDIMKLALKGLAAENLEKACEFYADQNRWDDDNQCRSRGYKDPISGEWEVEIDAGETATLALEDYRQAIAEIEGVKK